MSKNRPTKAEIKAMEQAAFRRGVECAADVARAFNGTTIHPYDLGDCILGKLNLIDRRIRKNKRAIESWRVQ